jgi:hypothetical protein
MRVLCHFDAGPVLLKRSINNPLIGMNPLILTNLILTIMANNQKNDRVNRLDQATIDKIVDDLLKKLKRGGVLSQEEIDKILKDNGLQCTPEIIDAIIATMKLMEQNNPTRETVSEGIKVLKAMQKDQ